MHRMLALVLLVACASASPAAPIPPLKLLLMGEYACVSHQINVLETGRELASRGHSMTFLLSDTETVSLRAIARARWPGLEVITHPGVPDIQKTQRSAQDVEDARNPLKAIAAILRKSSQTFSLLLKDNATMSRLKAAGFDMMLRDNTHSGSLVLGRVLGIPSVDLLPLGLSTQPWPSRFMGTGFSSYNPTMTVNRLPQTLLGRLENFAGYWGMHVLLIWPQNRYISQAFEEAGLPADSTSPQRASIVVSDFSFDFPQPLPPRVTMVGSVMADRPVKPLPEDLAAFLDSGLPEHPAVYASFGTIAFLLPSETRSVARGLSALPNPVLWKLAIEDMPGISLEELALGSNVRVVPWASQTDVLAHPSVGIFLTQGGINSVHEANRNAVPMVVLGLMADQGHHAWMVEHIHGNGLSVPTAKVAGDNGSLVRDAVQRVLTEPSFKERAVQMQKRAWRPGRSSVQLAADVVETAYLTGDDDYLETREHEFYWWQLALLDVYAVLAFGALALLTAAAGLLYGLYCGVRHLLQGRKAKQA